MQVVKNIFISLFIVWFAFLLFMPKQELYYALENVLLEQGIEINEKEMDSGLFSLQVKEVSVYVKGIKVATVDELNFFSLLFYNSVDIGKVKVEESLKSFAPESIDKTQF